jgi:serine/threonine protein kinase
LSIELKALEMSRKKRYKGEFVAPEVLKGKKYTQAADIYSLGILACEVFSVLF